MVWIFIEEFEDLIVIFCPSFPILLFLKHPFLLCVLQVQQTHQWHQGVQRTGPVSCVCITLFHTISCKHKIHSHFFFFFLMPPFSILLIYIPGLLFKDFNCHFSICVYPLSGSFTVKHHPFLCILFHVFLPFYPLFVVFPPCLISAFILITYSVFPFHLYSSAVTVIYLLFVLLRDCPKSVRIPFNHIALYVLMHCSDFLGLSGCLQRLHAQREAQVPQISSERAGHCFSWPTWTAWSKGNIKKHCK